MTAPLKPLVINGVLFAAVPVGSSSGKLFVEDKVVVGDFDLGNFESAAN